MSSLEGGQGEGEGSALEEGQVTTEMLALGPVPPAAPDEDQPTDEVPALPPESPANPPAFAPGAVLEPPRPGFLTRGRLRRRLRHVRSLRELQLRDLGGFAVELHRYGRTRPELIREKLESAAETDAEVRALERVLLGRTLPRELREARIGGSCSACGAVHGSADRYCASCGRALRTAGSASD